MEQIIVITDLDGTLLHPDTYSYDKVWPAVRLIKEKGIPLIFCSSKTRAEIEYYRRKLENSDPFIVENGGAIFIPKGYFKNIDGAFTDGDYEKISLGKSYEEIRKIFVEIRNKMKVSVKGFGDMTTEEIAEITRLTLFEAERAKLREFDEPFYFETKAPDLNFLKAVQNSGLTWTEGSFYHVTGDNDKGYAVKLLKNLYKTKFQIFKTIGLGDNLNDLSFLKEMDYPVIIPKRDGNCDPRLNIPGMIKAKFVGDKGWNDSILRLIGATQS